MRVFRWGVFVLPFLIMSCTNDTSVRPEPVSEDPFVWLENSEDPAALAWAAERNAKTLPLLKGDARFKGLTEDLAKILLAPDRLPTPDLVGDMVYNFWQDKNHVKGILRRTTLESYKKAEPEWETVFDLDKLNAEEKAKDPNKKPYLWGGKECLQPEGTRCLLRLSIQGTDAAEIREYDLSKPNNPVADGFFLPAGKSSVRWVDENTVLVGLDLGPQYQTESEYARTVRLWKRGTKPQEAKTVLEVGFKDIEAEPFVWARPEGTTAVLRRAITFFTEENTVVSKDGELQKLPLPPYAALKGVFQGYVIYLLREDLELTDGKTLAMGTLISFPIAKANEKEWKKHVEVVFDSDEESAFVSLHDLKDVIVLKTLKSIQSQLVSVKRGADGWQTEVILPPSATSVDLLTWDPFGTKLMVAQHDFMSPSKYVLVEGQKREELKKLPERFDASDLTMEQFFATSKDGTKVPYYVVHKKGMKLDGNNPTLQYGYGGFEISYLPVYNPGLGKVWLEKGGVYVLANIRGGGEFGPRWHKAALKENRQKAYDDFIAVSEDLIARKVTSPRRLGIRGGSNGGLLVGAAMTQRPDLYNAVLCEVALLDMIRYVYIHAGASWVDEYGDPRDPQAAEYIRKFSPYQNVKAGVNYPKALFMTPSTDDRVGPGHARKMAAKLESVGAPFLFFENQAGGHGGAGDLDERVVNASLQYVYLYQQLMD